MQDNPGWVANPLPLRLRGGHPVGWFAKESTTFLAPDGQGNVIMSTEPLDPGMTTQTYARIQGDLLRREFPQFQEFGFVGCSAFGGQQAYRRDFGWTPPDGVPVVQIQLYHASGGRGVTLTATAPQAAAARLAPAFEQIIADVRLAGPADVAAAGPALVAGAVPSAAPGRRPVTVELLAQAFSALGWSCELPSAGAVSSTVRLDGAADGRLLHLLATPVDSGRVLHYEARRAGSELADRQWWHALESVNTWNGRAPQVTASMRTGDDGRGRPVHEIVLRALVPTPRGVHLDELVEMTADVGRAAVDFWEWARRERGI